MPNVQLPDNSVVAFPDDMPEHEINSAIDQHLTGGVPIDPLGSFTDKATDMMTFGLDKPFNAAGIAAIDYVRGKGKYGDLYDQNMQQQKNIEKLESEQYPIASTLGNTAGFVGSLGMSVPAKAAPVSTDVWNTIKNVGRSSRNNAIIASGIGEANAFANTPGTLEDKAAATYPAGKNSALMGAAIPVVAQGAIAGGSKLLSPVIDRLTASDSDMAIAKIAKRFAQDNNITPEQAQTILNNLGPNASLADAGGANVQKLGKTVLNTPGKGANDTVNFLLGRQRGMGPRVQDIVKSGFGNNAEFNDTVSNLQAAQQERAAPLYNEAFSKNQSVDSPVINRILKTPAGQKALKIAAEKMQNDGAFVSVPDADLMEQANLAGSYDGKIGSGLKLRTLDYVKRAYDDMIGTAIKAGEKDNVRILSGAKNNLLKALDAADVTTKKGSPGLYAQGRAAFSDPAKSQEALEMGRNFMNEDSQITAKDVAKLDAGDKHFFQIGAARAISDKAAANPSNTVKNIISNDLWKQRLKAAMPSEDHYYDFLTNAHNEALMQGTKNSIMGNSSTASQLADMAEEGGGSGIPLGLNAGNLMDVARGDLTGSAMEIGKHLWNKATAPKPGVADELGKMLFNPNQNAKTISSWQQYLQPKANVPFAISPQLNPFGWQAARLTSE